MSKKSRLRGPIDKEHSKRARTLLKSAPRHLYHIYWSLPRQSSWKRSLLLTCQILGLFANILAANDKNPVLNSNELKIPVQMELSEKENPFLTFFTAFLKSRLNSEYFEKKMSLLDFVIRKLWTPKTWLDKCLKGVVLEGPLTSNMVKGA